jgi:molecular chaperone GrpE
MVDTQDNLSVEQDDVVFEPEQGEVKSSFGNSAGSQVAKLKKKLKEAQQSAKENLDGWQRLKADMANSKKAESERLARAKSKGAEEVLESLLPALDSFDSAMQGSAWESIDEAWRQGMEFVHSQLVTALESHGVIAYGIVGGSFNTDEYEAAEHIVVEDEAQANKVQKVLRKGYKNKSGVLRPARVVVGDFTA